MKTTTKTDLSYFRSISRLGSESYVPTDQDILWSRVRTTGISATSFGKGVDVYDVSGVRSERHKWRHCFENVGAILFTVDIASYDKLLCEDETVNDMSEALSLFDSIVNCQWFVNTKFALLFTKYDTLAAKLKASPMGKYFVGFDGGDDIEKAKAYITDRFVSLSKETIEVYYTSFIDDPRSPAKIAMDFILNNRGPPPPRHYS